MSKKLVKINGKTYLIDTETKELEEAQVEEDSKEEESAEESSNEGTESSTESTGETNDKDEEDTTNLDEAAEKVVQKLGIGEIQATLADIQKKLSEKAKKSSDNEASKKVSALLDLETLMEKSVDEMTPREKIVGFYQAMIQNNHEVLKALSEGTAADGGYLFPDEFRAEVIRDLAEGNFMRNEVTVVPMKRDVMKIPSLESRPKVTWTEENDTKATTTAHFNEQTLTVKKMAAILYASDELIEDSTEIDCAIFNQFI